MVAATDGSETRAPKVWVSRNVNFNDNAFPYRRGSAVTQGESEDDDGSQSDVDDLKSGSYEQCETTSTKTHAIQCESEENFNPDEGTSNVTDSTTAVQQTTTRCSGRTRKAPQHFGDYVTGRELENRALYCDASISSAFQAIQQTLWRIPTGKQRWTESSNHWKKTVSGSWSGHHQDKASSAESGILLIN